MSIQFLIDFSKLLILRSECNRIQFVPDSVVSLANSNGAVAKHRIFANFSKLRLQDRIHTSHSIYCSNNFTVGIGYFSTTDFFNMFCLHQKMLNLTFYDCSWTLAIHKLNHSIESQEKWWCGNSTRISKRYSIICCNQSNLGFHSEY